MLRRRVYHWNERSPLTLKCVKGEEIHPCRIIDEGWKYSCLWLDGSHWNSFIGLIANSYTDVQLHCVRQGIKMIAFPDGDYYKQGIDVIKVYRPDYTSVIKLRKFTADTEWYIAEFNKLFVRTAYEVLGFEKVDGVHVVKLRQPYVEFGSCTWEDARKELFYDMQLRFGEAEEHPWMPNELHLPGYFIDDLKEANVGIDIKSHKYAVIDCIIHPTNSVNDDLLWDIDKRWLAINVKADSSNVP